MQIKIGNRINIEADHQIVMVSLDGFRIGYIQEIIINFSAYHPNKSLVSICRLGENAETRVPEFAAEMAREGFDIHWVGIDELPKLKTVDPNDCWLEGAEPVALLEKFRKSAP